MAASGSGSSAGFSSGSITRNFKITEGLTQIPADIFSSSSILIDVLRIGLGIDDDATHEDQKIKTDEHSDTGKPETSASSACLDENKSEDKPDAALPDQKPTKPVDLKLSDSKRNFIFRHYLPKDLSCDTTTALDTIRLLLDRRLSRFDVDPLTRCFLYVKLAKLSPDLIKSLDDIRSMKWRLNSLAEKRNQAEQIIRTSKRRLTIMKKSVSKSGVYGFPSGVTFFSEQPEMVSDNNNLTPKKPSKDIKRPPKFNKLLPKPDKATRQKQRISSRVSHELSRVRDTVSGQAGINVDTSSDDDDCQ